MTGRRRGRTGRGWDAAPPRARAGGSSGVSGDSTPGVSGSGSYGSGSDGSGSYGSGGGGSGSDGSGGGGRRWGGRGTDSSAGGRSDRSGTGGQETDKPVDPAERAREICLRLLSFRPRTRAELATALRQKGIADEVAAEVLDRYSDVGIIDDEAFARAWVSSRHHGRGLARKALAGELRRKGVESDAVGAALDELDPEIEVETARALVERKLRGDRGTPAEALFRRLVGMLARKGYPAGLAFRVVKDVLQERADAAALETAELDVAELDTDLLDAEQRADEAQEEEWRAARSRTESDDPGT